MAVLNFLSRIYGIFFLTASIAMVRLSYKEIQKLNPSEPLKEREKSLRGLNQKVGKIEFILCCYFQQLLYYLWEPVFC